MEKEKTVEQPNPRKIFIDGLKAIENKIKENRGAPPTMAMLDDFLFLMEKLEERVAVAEDVIESHDETIESIETDEAAIRNLQYKNAALVLLVRASMQNLAAVISADEAVLHQVKGMVQVGTQPDGTPIFDYAPTVKEDVRTARNTAISEALVYLQDAQREANRYPLDIMADIMVDDEEAAA